MSQKDTNRIFGMTLGQTALIALMAVVVVAVIGIVGSVVLTLFHNQAIAVQAPTLLPTAIPVAQLNQPDVTPITYPTLPPEWTVTPSPTTTQTRPPTETAPPTATRTPRPTSTPTRRPRVTVQPSHLAPLPTSEPASSLPQIDNSAAEAAWAEYEASWSAIDRAISEIESYQSSVSVVPGRYTAGRFSELRSALLSAIDDANRKFAAYILTVNVPETAQAAQRAYVTAIIDWSQAYVDYWGFVFGHSDIPDRYGGSQEAPLGNRLDQAYAALWAAQSNYYSNLLGP